MLHLSRTVRFCLDTATGPPPPRHNGYSAWPPMRGLGRFYQLQVCCAGRVDPRTGYFINIKQVDQAFADHGLPFLRQCLAEGSAADIALGALMRGLIECLQPALRHSVHSLCLELSPFHSLTIGSRAMDAIVVRQQFDFSAAHRLHVPQLSDQENRRIFGKCNNPAGHGHNYHLEVSVRAPIDEHGRVLPVEDLDALVDEVVIRPLDHKHLNVDVPQFAELNPTVENIARVIYDLLHARLSVLNVALEQVSVWETPKTVCTYRGPGEPGKPGESGKPGEPGAAAR